MTSPADLACDVVLRDRSTVTLRPVRHDDEPLLLDFFRSLDERSLAFRFFTGAPDLDAVARALADVDQERRFGLLALRGQERLPVAHGFFAAIDKEAVEVAFAVSRDLQGHGLGSVLLAQLAERAAEEGFTRMVADVLPENHTMIAMFRASGFPVEVTSEPGTVVVEMPTSPDPAALTRFQERDATAARAAVATFFDATSVRLIDAPPRIAPAAARGLAAAGARAVVVRGDPEAWREAGPDRERELLAVCRRTGMRLVGPGSGGVLDNRPGRQLDLTTAATPPPPGGVGIVAQGAAAGRRLLDGAVAGDVGVSTFVSLGARADLSANDLLEYWEDDPTTTVALLQVESFSDPPRFARIARRLAGHLPIVVVAAHTAADPPGRGLFDQVGAIRAADTDEALALAAALADRPAGKRQDRARAQRRLPVVPPAPRADEAAAILATALAGDGTGLLDPESRSRLLACYGVAVEEGPERPPDAISLRVTVDADPLFGPVLRCGPEDQPAAEQPARVCPLGEGDAAALLDSLAPPVPPPPGREQLERVLTGVAALAAAHTEIAWLDLDPLLVAPERAVSAGARIGIRRPPRRRPWPRTWE
ncbi:MAG: GNAT family N-acetyltransferase [Actinobacteria bacterium]|nr:GNAT family N-acetyltransferase [Actinomycetota bacterium]